MFVRKKKNRSGTTSIVVVDKHGGKFKEIHTVGIAHNDDEINSLCAKGRQWINNHLGIQFLDFDGFSAQGGLSVADGCRCLTKELDMIAC